MAQTVLAWLSHDGSLALFFLLVAGIFGVPVPDETLLVAAGGLVANGTLRMAPTAAAAVLGSSTGITLSFIVGRLIGPPAVGLAYRVMRLPDDLLQRVRHWFTHLGKWALTFGYFVPGVRHLTAIVAGASSLPLGTFALFAYAGAVIWSATFLAIGYAFGAQLPVVYDAIERHAEIAAALTALVIALVGCWWWWRRTRRQR